MARQDARLQGEHARGSEQPRRSPQRDARSLTPRLSPTFHSSCPKSGDGASTQPLCSPSTSVLIPSETTPRTSDPSHDPSSTLPHVPRPKEAAGSRRSPASCEVSIVLGDRDCVNTRATRALVSRTSPAAIPPPPFVTLAGGRGGGGAPRREVHPRSPPASLSENKTFIHMHLVGLHAHMHFVPLGYCCCTNLYTHTEELVAHSRSSPVQIYPAHVLASLRWKPTPTG